MILAGIPSPARGVWYLGPIPIRDYAPCIIAGIIVAVPVTQKRWAARGGRAEDLLDISMWGGAVRNSRRPCRPRDHRPAAVLGPRTVPTPQTFDKLATPSHARLQAMAIHRRDPSVHRRRHIDR
jgi:hypothetical protein